MVVLTIPVRQQTAEAPVIVVNAAVLPIGVVLEFVDVVDLPIAANRDF